MLRPNRLDRHLRQNVLGVHLVARSVDEHERVLEEDGGTEGRDHRREARRGPQWPVGGALQDDPDEADEAHHHGREHEDTHHRAQAILQEERGEQGQPEVGAVGEEVAVGEVDELQDPVHHGVAEGDERVDAADGEAVGELLEELLHGFSSGF